MTRLNPTGLKGFSFLEFSAPDSSLLHQQFEHMGFSKTFSHQTLPIDWYEQNQIVFIVNATELSQAHAHAQVHGPGPCSMGFEVENAEKAYAYTLNRGAKSHDESAPLHNGLPGIQGIGGSVIYFTDKNLRPFLHQRHQISAPRSSVGLDFIDHLTHNVHQGHMDNWASFYEDLFNFEQIRYFDITGQKTGLISRAMASPDGSIKIPLNESKDEHSQIEEFLKDYHGEGIQHVALHTSQIYDSVKQLRDLGMRFLDVPDTYYELISKRLPWHQEPVEALKKLEILIDGEKDPKGGLLLQIFTENIFGPVFFEIIERKGNDGFGEGNFQALFEAIERDQMKRGTL